VLDTGWRITRGSECDRTGNAEDDWGGMRGKRGKKSTGGNDSDARVSKGDRQEEEDFDLGDRKRRMDVMTVRRKRNSRKRINPGGNEHSLAPSNNRLF